MRRLPLTLVMLLLASSIFSGCMSEPTNVDSEKETPLDENPNFDTPFSVHCIEYDDLERCWLLLVPTIVNESSTVPLVVDIHGGGDDMYQQRWTSDFANLSMEQGFIVAYPQGHNDLWNQGDGVLPGADQDDVGFILKMVEKIQNNHSIDSSRIYVTGWSNGCGMTHRLAVQSSDVFAAAGCMSMYQFAEVATGYTPIPFMEVHGILDEIVHYGSAAFAGVILGIPGTGLEQGAIQNLEQWANLNGCQGVMPEIIVVEDDYDIRGYTDCENETQVMLMTLFFAAHNPYEHDDPVTQQGRGWANPTGVPTSTIVWEFLSQFSTEIDESITM